MASSIAQCRGFTHPFVLLVRSTLRARCSLETSRASTSLPSALLTNHSQQRRSLFSGRALFNGKPKTPPAASTKTPSSQRPAAGSFETSVTGYARRLAMKKQPTTIFEGASQLGFLISSYGASCFCFGSAAINSWFNVYNLPPGISSWVPVGFGVISIVFAGLGTIFALRPSSIIRSIKVLPFEAPQNAAPGASHQRVLLEVAVRRISPIPLPLKRIKAEPERMVMLSPVYSRPVAVSKRDKLAQGLIDAERRNQERQYELDHIMTAPFRHAGQAGAGIFANVRRGLTGEGFAPMFINGIRYKLDLEGGYALENGQVLDRLIKIQPDPQLARIQSEPRATK